MTFDPVFGCPLENFYEDISTKVFSTVPSDVLREDIMDAQPMNSLKKNALSVIGWLSFVVSFQLLGFLLNYWVTNSQSYLISLHWHPFIYKALYTVIVFIANFFAYVFSWRLVVFPISRRGGLENAHLKYSLFVEWLVFCFSVFLFSLLVWLIIQILPMLISMSDETVSVIQPILQGLVSLAIYRETVLSYLSASTVPPENTEPQSVTPS